MRPVIVAFGRALLSQLHFRMLILTFLPFLLSVIIWGLALWLGLQPLLDWLQSYLVGSTGMNAAGGALSWLGLGALKAVIVPWVALWLLLPMMILTALVFVGLFALPAVARHVGGRHYATLSQRKGGSLFGSLWISGSSFLLFCVLWLITLPLWLIPPLAFIIPALLWGWLTYRVIAYDALSDYADKDELKAILKIHRWPLLTIGIITGMLGAAPTLLWLGGALWLVILPFMAAGSIWLYVLMFVFTGLWFEYYCLEALSKYRAGKLATIIIAERGTDAVDSDAASGNGANSGLSIGDEEPRRLM
ncbi:EI24 domain-containing protein [Glaciimonas sp. CA11.2]|uniref:EI24 domain-containing protein n=2 Tax=Glaciimonas sp. CA11.2 TaxID=3048601 RepID=UPI002AB3E7C8|nr:EI24 domain-containing protein [Glaciimonas sp. CA11.2]MDY7549052.1 EI24 domain-containing protein [Glaciimonas sp. CA11.2]